MRVLLTLTAIVVSALFSTVSNAHPNPAYSHDATPATSHPKWMATIADSTRLSAISIPGTHETMARVAGGDAVLCQSLSLNDQLASGIRALDIRCRHFRNAFHIHHAAYDQHKNFDDVLGVVIAFLQANPSETVLMRIKREYKDDGNTRAFWQTLDDYLDNGVCADYIWKPASPDPNPRLKDVRGKIVILRDFSSPKNYGINYHSLSTQDTYHMTTNADLYHKWTEVKTHLEKADGVDRDSIYMNYLSASYGSFPYFVASGHSSPQTGAPRLLTGKTTLIWKKCCPDFPRVLCVGSICSIAYEGTNVLTYKWLKDRHRSRVGIIMADFPGAGLINAIIDVNRR